jgi:lysophospholipase L1-like esterase
VSAIEIAADDERLAWWAPQPTRLERVPVRADRFSKASIDTLGYQVGPLANVRSSSGCALVLATDSPWVDVDLVRLRHHQPVAVGLDAEVQLPNKTRVVSSGDLREFGGDVRVRLATGLERGRGARPVWLWLPLISTCAVQGLRLASGAAIEAVPLPEPRWLALGDSLTQGFCAQQPTATWVHRLQRRWQLPAWNLGVGGLRVEPTLFAEALETRAWDLVTIGLGSNHAWRDEDLPDLAQRVEALCRQAQAQAQRVVWLLPPWKPLEAGKGPPEFMGVPLDIAVARRLVQIRDTIRVVTADLGVTVVSDLLPQDHRLYADGLHPGAWGMAQLADALNAALA